MLIFMAVLGFTSLFVFNPPDCVKGFVGAFILCFSIVLAAIIRSDAAWDKWGKPYAPLENEAAIKLLMRQARQYSEVTRYLLDIESQGRPITVYDAYLINKHVHAMTEAQKKQSKQRQMFAALPKK
ncbi:hypothetical protein ACJU26_08805 [Acidithiobacillus sp. M4-SHS-6]|uniref:hypothetical protein n=1 Tax=Acidithiobacillus sp. M4-SHS-6 TaxID=3383024 RepID=UPI0039BEB070